jgi:hypothetical protein
MKVKNKQLHAQVIPLSGDVAIPDWSQYVEFIDPNAQLFDLPDPDTHLGKLIVVRNATASGKKNSGNRPYQMVDALGNVQSNFAANSTTIIAANVEKWDIVSVDRPRSPTKLEPVVLAKGLINLGDPVPAGARPFANAFNVQSVTGLGTSTQLTRVAVLFATPLVVTDYFVDGEIVSNNPGNTQWQADTTLIWTTHNKTITGFNIAFREAVSQIQNVSFNFQVSGVQ